MKELFTCWGNNGGFSTQFVLLPSQGGVAGIIIQKTNKHFLHQSADREVERVDQFFWLFSVRPCQRSFFVLKKKNIKFIETIQSKASTRISVGVWQLRAVLVFKWCLTSLTSPLPSDCSFLYASHQIMQGQMNLDIFCLLIFFFKSEIFLLRRLRDGGDGFKVA